MKIAPAKDRAIQVFSKLNAAREANLAAPEATAQERVIYAAQQRLTPNLVPPCPVCSHRTQLFYAKKAALYLWRCVRPGRFKCWGSVSIDDQDAFVAFARGESLVL